MDPTSNSAFTEALKFGDLTQVIQEFQPIFLNQPDDSGCLPLHIASQNNDLDVYKFLLKQNCNIESKDPNGWRPIHFAVKNKNMDIIKLLVGFGCKLSMTDKILVDLLHKPEYEDIKGKIIIAIKNILIGKEMELKCSLECDHRFCLTSICFNEFSEGDFVNRGKFGKITKIIHSGGSRIFAIKKINWEPNSEDINGKVKNATLLVEENINKYRVDIVHGGIAKYYGAIISSYKMFIFMDYYPRGSIYDILNEFTNGLPDERLLKYTQQILEALRFLHGKRIIHRDLKSPNVLLDLEDNCKLADFGCSRLIESLDKYSKKYNKSCKKKNKNLPKSRCGTVNNMSPEMIMNSDYDFKSDIWSVGAMVYEMFSGKPLFCGMKVNIIIQKVPKGELPDYQSIKENPNNKIISLMDSIFIVDPNQRPTAEELIKKHFVT